MHGLTGGSWKRSKRQPTDTGKNDLAGNHETTSGPVTYRRTTLPRQLSTLRVSRKGTRSDWRMVGLMM